MKPNAAFGTLCLALLAVQFGTQPLLTQYFVQADHDNMTTFVLLGEVVKALTSGLFIFMASEGGFAVVRT